VERGVHPGRERVVRVRTVERDRQDAPSRLVSTSATRAAYRPLLLLAHGSVEARLAGGGAPLDAYSRVVTEVAGRLVPVVANLRVSRGAARAVAAAS
jgi:hypothetical protein